MVNMQSNLIQTYELKNKENNSHAIYPRLAHTQTFTYTRKKKKENKNIFMPKCKAFIMKIT